MSEQSSFHILFLTDNFPPEVNAPATRTYEHCREWIKQGVEVTVITCAPNFPQGKVYPGYRNRLCSTEWMDGIRVIRVWSYMTANEGFAKRVLDYTSFAFMSFWAGLFRKADIIVATSPQFFTTLSGFALSKLKRRPWVFELRDLWPESIKTVGAMGESRLLSFLEKVELFLYRDADLVVALTDAFKANLVRRGIDNRKIEVVTNGANLEALTPREKNADLVQRLGLEDKFVIGYIGTHGMAHSLEFIVNAIKGVRDQDIHFLFIGDGARKQAVLSLAETLKLSNATFLPPVPKASIADYLSILDAALVPLKRSDTFKTVIPSKIFEAAAMRKPILLGVDGEARQIIESTGAGVYFEPENEQDFLRQVQLLKTDRDRYVRLQAGCGRLASAYDRTTLALSMLDKLELCSGKKRAAAVA